MTESPSLRLLVSKSKTWNIRSVSLVALRDTKFKDTNLFLKQWDKLSLHRKNLTMADLDVLNIELKEKLWDSILIKSQSQI